eukprot:TRINITY_DN25597_c0_g1_i3.p2 TRINITY_DN25597_c0_g1~~TRINITY_DN25597_c0_g1_i3.p2  ORF type:complete len:260 (-),score=43.08 TRINITY_DN25597_c0_g1_i3:834-1592(-)
MQPPPPPELTKLYKWFSTGQYSDSNASESGSGSGSESESETEPEAEAEASTEDITGSGKLVLSPEWGAAFARTAAKRMRQGQTEENERVARERQLFVRADVQRTHDLVAEFGADRGRKIRCLEAKLNAKFTSLCDLNNPVLWPAVPLRFSCWHFLSVVHMSEISRTIREVEKLAADVAAIQAKTETLPFHESTLRQAEASCAAVEALRPTVEKLVSKATAAEEQRCVIETHRSQSLQRSHSGKDPYDGNRLC